MQHIATYAAIVHLHDDRDVISYYVDISKDGDKHNVKINFSSGTSRVFSCMCEDEIDDMTNDIVDEAILDYHSRVSTKTGVIGSPYQSIYNRISNCEMYFVILTLVYVIYLSDTPAVLRIMSLATVGLYVAGKIIRYISNVKFSRGRSKGEAT